MSEDVRRIVERMLPSGIRLLTYKDIVRIKQYTADENYGFYIAGKKRLEDTIRKANTALRKIEAARDEARRLVNEARAELNRFKSEARSRIAEVASQAQSALQQAASAIDRARDAKYIADQAYAVVQSLQSALQQLSDRISLALDAYNKHVDSLSSKAGDVLGYADAMSSIAESIKSRLSKIFDAVGYAEVDLGKAECGKSEYLSAVGRVADWGFAPNMLGAAWNVMCFQDCMAHFPPDIEHTVRHLVAAANYLVNATKELYNIMRELIELGADVQALSATAGDLVDTLTGAVEEVGDMMKDVVEALTGQTAKEVEARKRTKRPKRERPAVPPEPRAITIPPEEVAKRYAWGAAAKRGRPSRRPEEKGKEMERRIV